MVHRKAQPPVRSHAQTVARTGQPVVVEGQKDREPKRRGRREETAREVEEMLGMCVYMGGGPALMYAAAALAAYEEFGGEKAAS